MKVYTIFVTVLLAFAIGAEIARVSRDYYKGAYPEIPSVTVMSRGTGSSSVDFRELVDVARRDLFGEQDPLSFGFEHVLVVENSSTWTVSFLFRGNLVLEPARFLGIPFSETVIVGDIPVATIDKDSLTIVEDRMLSESVVFHFFRLGGEQ